VRCDSGCGVEMRAHDVSPADFSFEVSMHILRIRTEEFCLDACRYLEKLPSDFHNETGFDLGRELGTICMKLAVVASEIKRGGRLLSDNIAFQHKLSEVNVNIKILFKDFDTVGRLPFLIRHELTILGMMVADACKLISVGGDTDDDLEVEVAAETPAASELRELDAAVS